MRSGKKIDLPDKPSPPTFAQMEEDLINADRNDIVFTFFSDSKEQDGTPEEIDILLSTLKQSKNITKDNLFTCASKCVETNNLLDTKVSLMKENEQNLEIVCKTLEETVDRVKEVASDAMRQS